MPVESAKPIPGNGGVPETPNAVELSGVWVICQMCALREKLARALRRFEVLAERGIIGAEAAVADLKGDGNAN